MSAGWIPSAQAISLIQAQAGFLLYSSSFELSHVQIASWTAWTFEARCTRSSQLHLAFCRVSCLNPADDLTPSGNSRVIHVWPPGSLTLCLYLTVELVSLHTCVFLRCGSRKSVTLFFSPHVDVMRQDQADWREMFVSRCLEGVNCVSF